MHFVQVRDVQLPVRGHAAGGRVRLRVLPQELRAADGLQVPRVFGRAEVVHEPTPRQHWRFQVRFTALKCDLGNFNNFSEDHHRLLRPRQIPEGVPGGVRRPEALLLRHARGLPQPALVRAEATAVLPRHQEDINVN